MESCRRRISITTPTPCLRCVPRLTSCGQLRFISAIALRASFLFGSGASSCICYYQPRTSSFTVPQSRSPSTQTPRITGQRRLWVSFHRPPSPTPTQGLLRKSTAIRPCWQRAAGFVARAYVHLPPGASDASFTPHRNQTPPPPKKNKRTLRNKIHTLASL